MTASKVLDKETSVQISAQPQPDVLVDDSSNDNEDKKVFERPDKNPAYNVVIDDSSKDMFDDATSSKISSEPTDEQFCLGKLVDYSSSSEEHVTPNKNFNENTLGDYKDFKLKLLETQTSSPTKQLENINIAVDKAELAEVVFEDADKKCRGRPLGTIQKTLCGAPLVPNCQTYEDMSDFKKAKLLLYLLGNDKLSLLNILDFSYRLQKEDVIKINEKNLKDTFIDSKVDISILERYTTKDYLKYLNKIVKQKRKKNIFICDLCFQEADDLTIQCDTCLMWYHFTCVKVEAKDLKKNEPWFCVACVNFFQ
ncbi:uncharacterized protein LOC116416066 [Nasonia vitripennis]|uniref:PHD-type domain-containing protein n=1 Tax=Nasonia vitripennis TaxID=7425 RepID=A0A7M7T6Q6_NASVI|nr:uncharacterized protein LOC116416066 [Nasonia vitripennis]